MSHRFEMTFLALMVVLALVLAMVVDHAAVSAFGAFVAGLASGALLMIGNDQPSWVPVSERLPEHEECVLIGHPEGFVGEARFHKLSDNRIDWLFEPSPVRGEPWSGRRAVPAPTVWQPLPAPPKED